MITKRSKERRQFICGSLCLLILAVILFIRNFYSFCWSDEAFYVANVQKLYIGERPFADNRHPTQFCAPLLLPMYHIYVGIKGTAEGIYLWSRIFNLILAFLSAELSYYVLRKYFALENWLSVAGGAIIMLYCKANVGGLSYHNFFFFNFIMAVMLAYMGMCHYRTNSGCRKYAGICYVSGLLCGMAIITIPTCVLAAGAVYIGLAVCVIRKNPIEKRHPLWFHIGGAWSMGTAYALWVFSRIKITEFFHMLPYLFDEDHEPKNIAMLLGTIWDVISSLGRDILIVTVVVCMIRMFFFMRYKKNREWMMAALYGLVAVSVAITLIRLSDSHMSSYVIFSMLGIALLVLNADCVKMKALLSSNKNVFYLFLRWWL